jgi:hypothetical protein
VLFDTKLLVRELEALYRGMWADFAGGRLPQPDLANLDAYLPIGAAFDHEGAEASFDPQWEDRWRAAVARRHAYAPLPPDRRFHPDAGR